MPPFLKDVEKFPTSPGILTYYGNFKQEGTVNLIIEFANKGSLEEYFEHEGPPTNPQDIANFWHAFYQIVDGYHTILKHLDSLKVEDGLLPPLETKSIFVVDKLDNKPSGTTYKHQFKLGWISKPGINELNRKKFPPPLLLIVLT